MKTNLNNVIWTKIVALAFGLTLAVGGAAAHAGGHGGGGHGGGGHGGGSRSMSGGSSFRGSSMGSMSNKMSSGLGGSQFKKSSGLSNSSLNSRNVLSQSGGLSSNSGFKKNTGISRANLASKNTGIAGGLNLNKNSGNSRGVRSNNNISNKIGKLNSHHDNSHHGDHKDHGQHHDGQHGKHHDGQHGKHIDPGFCHKNPHCKPCPTNHWCPKYCPGIYWCYPVGCWNTFGRSYVGVVEVPQVVAVPVASATPIDLQLKNIELLGAGNSQAGVGPLYRITILNNSTVPVEAGFDVGLAVTNGEDPSERSPLAMERIEGIDADELLFVEIQLPEVANRMAQSPSGELLPFSTLFVAVDARQEITESEETNNSAKVARVEVPVVSSVANF